MALCAWGLCEDATPFQATALYCESETLQGPVELTEWIESGDAPPACVSKCWPGAELPPSHKGHGQCLGKQPLLLEATETGARLLLPQCPAFPDGHGASMGWDPGLLCAWKQCPGLQMAHTTELEVRRRAGSVA